MLRQRCGQHTLRRTAYCWIFCELCPFSWSGGSTPSLSASSAHVLSSLVSSFLISSNRVKVLKLLPPLFGGVRNASRNAAVSVSRGTPGLQARMKATKASSIEVPSTFRSGSARRGDGGCAAGPGEMVAGEAVKMGWARCCMVAILNHPGCAGIEMSVRGPRQCRTRPFPTWKP